MRPPTSSGGTLPYRRLTIGLVVVLAALIVATFRNYGLTWDEPDHDRQGEATVRYYQEWWQTGDRPEYRGERPTEKYGGLVEIAIALAKPLTALPWYDTRHLVTALFGLLAILGAGHLAFRLGGWRAAFWSIALLAATPRFYGHLFNNPKDIPFAAGYVWSVSLLVRSLPHLPRIPTHLSLGLGAAIGATLGVRVGGLLLLVYLGLLLAISVAAALFREGTAPARKRLATLGDAARSFAIAAIPAYLIMLAFWPWAQSAPFSRPLQALSVFHHLTAPPMVLFAGRAVPAQELPASYLTHLLAITLPEIVLVLLLAGTILAIRRTTRLAEWTQRDGSRSLEIVLVAFAATYPLVHIAATGGVVFDGARHVLFVVPPLVVLSACVLARLTNRMANAPIGARRAVWALVLAGLGWQVVTMVRLHPYQSVYFNRLVGGLAGAGERYDTDYWTSAHREAVLQLIARTGVGDPEQPTRIWVCASPQTATPYFPPGFLLDPNRKSAHWLLVTSRVGCARRVAGTPVVRVERFGVPLVTVFERVRSARSEKIFAVDSESGGLDGWSAAVP